MSPVIHKNSPLAKLKPHVVKIALAASAALLAVGGLSLGSVAFSPGKAETDVQVAQLLVSLKEDRAAAQESLTQAHETLLGTVSGAEVSRTNAAKAAARELVLALAAASKSPLTLRQAQQRLDARFDYLDASSPVLGGFLPLWLQDTSGVTFVVSKLDVQSGNVDGDRYSHMALATLESVGGENPVTQTLLLRFDSDAQGAISGVDVSRASLTSPSQSLKQDTAPQVETPGAIPTN